jgi:hypothetical protein
VRERVEAVLADSRIQRAFRFLTDNEPKIEADQIRFTLIPSPPFEEAERAAAFNSELRALGMKPVVDAVGNVIAPYEQFGPSPVAVCAHLDTVFPASTPLDLRRRGRTLYLPGISDNGSGIVALLWVYATCSTRRLGRITIANSLPWMEEGCSESRIRQLEAAAYEYECPVPAGTVGRISDGRILFTPWPRPSTSSLHMPIAGPVFLSTWG